MGTSCLGSFAVDRFQLDIATIMLAFLARCIINCWHRTTKVRARLKHHLLMHVLQKVATTAWYRTEYQARAVKRLCQV